MWCYEIILADMSEPLKNSEICNNLVCRACGYSLKGLERRQCPECGTHFDPAELRTFYATSETRIFALYMRTISMMMAAMFGTTLLSIAIQALAYADQKGPRSREWIVHNLPAPFHYIVATVAIPLALFGVSLLVLMGRYFKETKRTRNSNSWIVRRVSPLLLFAVILIMVQLGCVYTCATIGD